MAIHRINRVEIELHGSDVQLARAVSERVGRMHGGRIAPVLDRVCSELSRDAAPLRLDRLELDLGPIAEADFEADFVAKLEQALRSALAAALVRRPPGDDPRARAALELLETFALTGGLPWWADPQDGDVVARHFAQAAAEAQVELVALVRRLADDPGALDRIARACDGDALVALVGRFAVERPRPPRGVAPAERLALLLELAERGSAATRGPTERTAAEHRAAVREAAGRVTAGDTEAGAEAQVDERRAGAESMRAPGTPHSRRLTPDDQARPSPDQPARNDALAPAPDELVGSAFAPRVAPPPDLAPTPPILAQRPPPGPPRPPPAPPAAPAAAIRTIRRGALARLDELYIDDAGLVLLWPFLERFLTRAGLLGEDRRFLDETAQLQAVALVEALATADPAPLEFRLPLAKLLCGRPLESDFHLDHPLTPEQLAEAEHLLAAVIDHARVPGELSIESVRFTFLQRPGALTTRDGAWLLHVERRPHDVILDRLPWSWGWVKLPWMPDPLRVEW